MAGPSNMPGDSYDDSSWDDFLRDVSATLRTFCTIYSVGRRDAFLLTNLIKQYAAVYHDRVESGEITEDRLIHRDDQEAAKLINELLANGDEGDEI